MKHAFTMIELIFVIVIVGIISAMIAPSFQGNNLRQAADQLVSHIRYTQHLAMMDNKFDVNDAHWFIERWTIRIKKDLVYTGASLPNGTFSDVWSYSIYNDKSHDGNPNLSEMAINPLNGSQYLSGGYNNTLHMNDESSMRKMRLGEEYGIDMVTFTGGCRNDTKFIHFDYIGRPFNSFPNNNLPYQIGVSGWHRLLTSPCDIILSSGIVSETIRIEPETGYTHIL